MSEIHESTGTPVPEQQRAAALTLDARLRLDPAVGVAVLDQESMLLDPETGAPYLLDGPGTLVVSCLDGVSRLRDIAGDIASALGADPEQVGADILELVKVLGGRGLLEGVAREQTQSRARHEGLAVGSPAGQVDGRDLDGNAVTNATLTGTNVLVNWSTTCGYCSLVRDELAALSVDARLLGVRIWLVTTLVDDALRLQVQDSALNTLVSVPRPPLFDGHGTPTAYVLDEDDRVARPVAIGAFDVPAMIRELLGLST